MDEAHTFSIDIYCNDAIINPQTVIFIGTKQQLDSVVNTIMSSTQKSIVTEQLNTPADHLTYTEPFQGVNFEDGK